MKRTLVLCLALQTALTAQAGGGDDHTHASDPPASKKTVAAASSSPSVGAPARVQGEVAQRLADGSLFVPKSVQRALGIRTELAVGGDFSRTVEMPGRVVADPQAAGRVQATQAGTIRPGPRGLAIVGQKVRQGEVLAYLEPTQELSARAEKQAALAELGAQAQLLEKRLARLTQLEDSVPRKDIDQTRIELESLKLRQQAMGTALLGRLPLTAPVSGVVAASTVGVGQIVDAREMLFEIVDPQRLAVEALAFDATTVSQLGNGSASIDGKPLQLTLAGAGRSLREQGIPVLFRILSKDKSNAPPVVVGQSLKVQVELKGEGQSQGVAVPASSITRTAANDPQLWTHDEAERFVARRIQVVPLSADRVLVTSGLKGGERVVSLGAQSLNQVR